MAGAEKKFQQTQMSNKKKTEELTDQQFEDMIVDCVRKNNIKEVEKLINLRDDMDVNIPIYKKQEKATEDDNLDAQIVEDYPLTIAIKNANKQMVDLLLDKGGANANVRVGASKDTCLHVLARLKNEDMLASFLFKTKADEDPIDKNAKNDQGETPIMIGMKDFNVRVIGMLLVGRIVTTV